MEADDGEEATRKKERKRINALETVKVDEKKMEENLDGKWKIQGNNGGRGAPYSACYGCGGWHWWDECTIRATVVCERCGGQGHTQVAVMVG